MTTKTQTVAADEGRWEPDTAPNTDNLPARLSGPRLAYHPAIKDKYGVSVGEWKVLCEAIFPSAKTPESIGMALAYCKARNLDIFKRPVHIVPMYSSASGGEVETVWPGIAELRTTASRTGQYAGCDDLTTGPLVTRKFAETVDAWEGPKGKRQKVGSKQVEIELTFHEWAQMTVYKIIAGTRVVFVGPKVYWLEVYATQGFRSKLPNDRWQRSPFGQHEKCAEAAALRRAFPEEIGNDYAAEEMEGRVLHPSTEIEATPIRPRLIAPPSSQQIESAAHKQPEATESPVDAIAEEPAAEQPAEDAKPASARMSKREKPSEAEPAEPFDSDAWATAVVRKMDAATSREELEAIHREMIEPNRERAAPYDLAEVETDYGARIKASEEAVG